MMTGGTECGCAVLRLGWATTDMCARATGVIGEAGGGWRVAGSRSRKGQRYGGAPQVAGWMGKGWMDVV